MKENEIKQRTIKLAPVKVKYTSGNSIPFAFVTKRNATKREARYILETILGFNLTDSLDGYEGEERSEFIEGYTKALNDTLNGVCDWEFLNEACECYEDQNVIVIPSFMWMLSYCQDKGII